MPRIDRGLVDGFTYHVMNRGNGGQTVFHDSTDYQVFVDLMKKAKGSFSVKLFAYCLMPNHFHIVVSPQKASHLSRWMQWVMTGYVRRYHHEYGTRGHLWEGRFKSFIVQADASLLTLARYVESNPVRGGLVSSGQEWRWSSHGESLGKRSRWVTDDLPVELPRTWGTYIDTPMKKVELEKLRESVRRQSPYGAPGWQSAVCSELGLESTIRPRGRPKKSACPLYSG